MRLAALHALCAPLNVLTLLQALLLRATVCDFWQWRGGVLYLLGDPEHRFWRGFRWSWSIGHVIVMNPAHGPETRRHEELHIPQSESGCMLGWLVGLGAVALGLSPLWLPLFVVGGPAINYACAAAVSLLHGHGVRGRNHLEDHGYPDDDVR